MIENRLNQTKTPWARAAIFTGDVSSDSPATLSSPTYVFDGGGSKTSYIKWKPIRQTDPPTLRVFRSKHPKRIAYFLSVSLETEAELDNNDDALTSITVGERSFFRPNHTHCVLRPENLENEDLNANLGVYAFDVEYPNGDPVEFAVVEDANQNYRATGDNAGNVLLARNTLGVGSIVVRTQNGLWKKTFNAAFGAIPNPIVLAYETSNPWSVESTGIKMNYWPQLPFQSYGIDYIGAGQDWMPPFALTTTAVFTGTAHLMLVHLDHIRRQPTADGLLHQDAFGMTLRNGQPSETVSDPLALYFVRADLLPIDPGLYRRRTSSTPTSPDDVWEGVLGSDLTGYDPPAGDPLCPFVVKQGEL